MTPLVAVAIPTFRRPELLTRLLRSIAAQRDAPPMVVLVADNDGAGQVGLAAVATLAPELPFAVDAFPVAVAGLCNVRNALVARALAKKGVTHIALIDDDQWAEPDWLAALLRQSTALRCDVTGGPVHYRFDGEAPDWTEAAFVFQPEQRSAGQAAMLWNLANTISTRACWEATPQPWFDLAFNQTGGEDLDLYMRWHAAGRTFGWAPGALVNESVPADRAQLGWLWRRLWRIGNTDAIVAWKYAGLTGKGAIVARTLALGALAVVQLPLALVSRRARVRRFGRVVRMGGRIAGLTGYAYREYGN